MAYIVHAPRADDGKRPLCGKKNMAGGFIAWVIGPDVNCIPCVVASVDDR